MTRHESLPERGRQDTADRHERLPKRGGWQAVAACALGVAAVLASSAFHPATAAPSAEPIAILAGPWVQLGPSGASTVRLVTSSANCPSVLQDVQLVPMQVRAPAAPDFPVLVCEASIAPGTSVATIDGQLLPLPRADPRRIVLLGDTGCRIDREHPLQLCNEPGAWPFAQVAASAAAWQPDLVIHTGDYYYRKMPCPPDVAGCAGGPSGDNWAVWDTDLFTPAAPLFRAAPWLFVRGNHELCSDGGAGWFRFLDPSPPPESCQDHTEPYAVPLGDLQLLVLDSARAADYTAAVDLVARYEEQFAAIERLAGPRAWLLTHNTLWGLVNDADEGQPEQLEVRSAALQAASNNRLPAGVELVLSGHIHQFQVLDFAGARPPQIDVGNSGVQLASPLRSTLVGRALAGLPVAAAWTINRFGFATLEPSTSGWRLTEHDVTGAPELTCDIQDRRATCAP